MPCNSFSLNPAYIFWATSRWTSNMTSLPPNTTWFTLFLSFYLKLLASLSSHVVLGLQRDIATSQYDVVHAFSPLLPQITRFLVESRRVGPPSRHRTLPTRRGASSLHKKPPALHGWFYLFFYLNSNVQSNLKLAWSKRYSGKRRGPQELEPIPACL